MASTPQVAQPSAQSEASETAVAYRSGVRTLDSYWDAVAYAVHDFRSVDSPARKQFNVTVSLVDRPVA